MQSLNFFFGIQLGTLVFRYTDKSSSTLRYTPIQWHSYKQQTGGGGGGQGQIGTFLSKYKHGIKDYFFIVLIMQSITSKGTYFIKSIPEDEDYLIFLFIIDHSVYDDLLPYLEIKSEKLFDSKLGKMFFKQLSFISGLGDLTRSLM